MKKFFFLIKTRKDFFNRGMTFIELIVIMGIFGAISATVLFNYGDFSSNVKLQNLAQDIALQIKQAQTDAVSGRIPIFPVDSTQFQNVNTLIPSPGWKPSYGIAFDTSSNIGPTGFVYYFNKAVIPPPIPASLQPNRFFDDFSGTYTTCGASGDSECLQEINITSGAFIDMICFNFSAINAESCDGIEGTQAFISFTRPRSNAIILDNSNQDDGSSSPGNTRSNVYIQITSPSGAHRYISVWASGYVSVN